MCVLSGEFIYNLRNFVLKGWQFFFFVGQKLIESTNKYVFTATFERGKGSKSDVGDTFRSE